MFITREYLHERINSLSMQKEQALGTANACEGAIRTLYSLIEHLDTPESENATDQEGPEDSDSDEEAIRKETR